MKILNLETSLLKWYRQSLAKFVLLSFILSFLIFVSFAVPYINIIFSTSFVILAFLCIWYILFTPPLETYVFIILGILIIICLLTLFHFSLLAEYAGNLVYLFLIFIFGKIFHLWRKDL